MKIKKQKGYIGIYGNTWVIKFDQFLVGKEKEVRAAAYVPFIFFKNEEFEIPWIVNHELVHFRQTLELLGIGALLLLVIENIYYRFVLGMNKAEAYFNSSLEQEAYLNHGNADYLKERKMFSTFKYLFKKKKFICNPVSGEIKII